MSYPKTKSILKSELAIGTSSHYHQQPHTIVIDESTIFWLIEWSKKGTDSYLTETMYQYIKARLLCQDGCFVFDRYSLYRIKGSLPWENNKNKI